ncbi:hypothetical protein OPQ81_010324 [Rhizoctonia solani]|nr:hypothetical protein OPQ81_010324 [Rhizoctonia solani]
MSLKTPKLEPKLKSIRHRITGIKLDPLAASRQISIRLLIDKLVIAELPWIKDGEPLEWYIPIVCDTPLGSELTLEAREKHTLGGGGLTRTRPNLVSKECPGMRL